MNNLQVSSQTVVSSIWFLGNNSSPPFLNSFHNCEWTTPGRNGHNWVHYGVSDLLEKSNPRAAVIVLFFLLPPSPRDVPNICWLVGWLVGSCQKAKRNRATQTGEISGHMVSHGRFLMSPTFAIYRLTTFK